MTVISELRSGPGAAVRTWYEGNRFVIMLGGVMAVSLLLVSIAMGLYNTGEAAQLDLSGPRYVDVRDKVVQDSSMTSFPANGVFTQQAFDDFFKAYDENQQAIQQVNGYDPAAVNNDSFNLIPTTPAPAQ